LKDKLERLKTDGGKRTGEILHAQMTIQRGFGLGCIEKNGADDDAAIGV